MQEYKRILDKILTKGKWQDTRAGKCKVVFNESFELDDITTLGKPRTYFNFPLVTTKKLATKSMAVELEGFINGITNKGWYQRRGCNIWNEWHNRKGKENDLGPIYGYQWRTFNKTYKTQDEDDGDYFNYADQLEHILHSLHNNSTDRRMVCSAWNPNQIDHMALPPCHLMWMVGCIDDVLNMKVIIRSWDALLGAPFNIASYALLFCLLCDEFDLVPGSFKIDGFNVHLYENQIDAAKLVLERDCYPLPSIQFTHPSKKLLDWTHKDFFVHDYQHHPAIKVEVAV